MSGESYNWFKHVDTQPCLTLNNAPQFWVVFHVREGRITDLNMSDHNHVWHANYLQYISCPTPGCHLVAGAEFQIVGHIWLGYHENTWPAGFKVNKHGWNLSHELTCVGVSWWSVQYRCSIDIFSMSNFSSSKVKLRTSISQQLMGRLQCGFQLLIGGDNCF